MKAKFDAQSQEIMNVIHFSFQAEEQASCLLCFMQQFCVSTNLNLNLNLNWNLQWHLRNRYLD
jgi:hypothetical protein